MARDHRTLRKLGTALLSATLMAVAVAAPLMERADLVHEPVVESEHHPATCPPAHDHTICTQVGANFSAAAPTPVRDLAPRTLLLRPRARTTVRVTALLDEGHRSRAPPTA